MGEFGLVLVGAVLVNNVVLTKFLGLCPFFGTSRRFDTALGLALATAFVLTLASALSYAIFHALLVPLGLEYLRSLAFILLVAVLVQLSEFLLSAYSPLLHRLLGLYLPLITSNCAVLGVMLLNHQAGHGLAASILYGFGAAVGFGLVLIGFAALRDRLEAAPAPEAMRGAPLAFLTAGFMALAFSGFGGMAP
ncbi:MAG: electron transport complex subunit A [Lysobacterales bacterium]|jgi:electron transport complex protein RnfA|nr:MAG: electron transport complex subunit A [Xanthomonadales bacterium]